MKHYKRATVFVDHFSHLHFVYLQLTTSSDKTMAAKNAFEKFAAEHGVTILHYHCDNRRFYDNACSRHVTQDRSSPFVG